MKVALALLLTGFVACALAIETEDLKDKSLTKETKDQVSSTASSDIASSSTTSSDIVSSSTASSDLSSSSSIGTTQAGDSSSTSTKPGDQSKPRFCTRQYAPVCASNSKTFNNQCEFENAQKLDPTLTVTRMGSC